MKQRSILSFFGSKPTGNREKSISKSPTSISESAPLRDKNRVSPQQINFSSSLITDGRSVTPASVEDDNSVTGGTTGRSLLQNHTEGGELDAGAKEGEVREEGDTQEEQEEEESESPVRPQQRRAVKRARLMDSDESESESEAGVRGPGEDPRGEAGGRTSPAGRAEEEQKEASCAQSRPASTTPVRAVAAKAASKQSTSKGTAAAASKAKKKGTTNAKATKKIKTSETDGAHNNKDKTDTTGTKSTFDPSKANYHPVDDACWAHGESTPYLALAKTFEVIEKTSGRLRIIEILSNTFRSVILLTPADLVPCVYLCLNQLAPAYEALELGVGESILMKALALAIGSSVEKVKAEAQSRGDLGAVAETMRSKQRLMFALPKLTVNSVFKRLKQVASMSGNTVQSKKVELIQSLVVACRECEAKFLMRSLSGKLRIGLAEQSLLVALATAVVTSPPAQGFPPEIVDAGSNVNSEKWKVKVDKAVLLLKTTYCACPNYDSVIGCLLDPDVGLSPTLSERCRLTPGIPLKPMLAHPTKGVGEILKRFDTASFTCEYKYDGERCQIHLLSDGSVKIFSRNQEDNSTKYPDLVCRIADITAGQTVTSFVLDSEAVAWDREAKQILPFQVLSTRKRKDVDEADIKVQVCIYAFDLLYLNGESLVTLPLRERREKLRSNFNAVDGKFVFATSLDTTDTEEIGEFLEEAIRGNCEGLMVKTLDTDSTYEIAKRSHSWLKLKKDYLEGCGDTLDLVVVAAYHGAGRRAGRFGCFLLAAWDPDNEELQPACRVGTGFRDADLEALTETLRPDTVPRPRTWVRWQAASDPHPPDVWLEPRHVWEVRAADLSISPAHTAAAGLVDPEKGISLRFPRFLRVRDDKKVEDATTSHQLASMYRNQEQIKNQEGTASSHAKASAKSAIEEDELY